LTGVESYNFGLNGRSLGSRGVETDEKYPPGVTYYLTMPDDLDIISVALGVNDYHNQTRLGTTDSINIKEFNGALNIVCEGLLSKYSGKIITFFTPFQRLNDSTKAIPLSDYVKSIIERGNHWGIPVYDTYSNTGFNPNVEANTNMFMKDSVHLNDLAH